MLVIWTFVIPSSFVIRFSSFPSSILALIRLIRRLNDSFLHVARRLRRGFQECLLFVFLVERFDRYRAPDLDRFLVFRLDRDRFPYLWSGFCGWSARSTSGCGVTRCLYFTHTGRTVSLLIIGCLRCQLRRRLGFERRLDRIVRVVVS